MRSLVTEPDRTHGIPGRLRLCSAFENVEERSQWLSDTAPCRSRKEKIQSILVSGFQLQEVLDRQHGKNSAAKSRPWARTPIILGPMGESGRIMSAHLFLRLATAGWSAGP